MELITVQQGQPAINTVEYWAELEAQTSGQEIIGGAAIAPSLPFTLNGDPVPSPSLEIRRGITNYDLRQSNYIPVRLLSGGNALAADAVVAGEIEAGRELIVGDETVTLDSALTLAGGDLRLGRLIMRYIADSSSARSTFAFALDDGIDPQAGAGADAAAKFRAARGFNGATVTAPRSTRSTMVNRSALRLSSPTPIVWAAVPDLTRFSSRSSVPINAAAPYNRVAFNEGPDLPLGTTFVGEARTGWVPASFNAVGSDTLSGRSWEVECHVILPPGSAFMKLRNPPQDDAPNATPVEALTVESPLTVEGRITGSWLVSQPTRPLGTRLIDREKQTWDIDGIARVDAYTWRISCTLAL